MKHFDYSKPMKSGSELTSIEQAYVKRAFVHRFTRDHKPQWAYAEWKDGKAYPVQFDSDADWLAHTLFQTTKTGALDFKCEECESSSTWPDNPELRKASECVVPL